MSQKPASAAARLEGLSETKARLMRRLLDERAKQEETIERAVRTEGQDGVRMAASYAQQRLWFIHRLDPQNASYNISLCFRLRGALDAPALRTALTTLVQRHESLRTVFVTADGIPQQKIVASGSFELLVVDLRSPDTGKRDALIRQHKIDEARGSFDLERGPLARGRLLQLPLQEHVLLVTMHHIISDGWSLRVFTEELSALYAASCESRDAALEPLPIQYGDYAEWQRRRIERADSDKELDYWRSQLAGIAAQLELPTDRPRPPVQSYRGGKFSFQIDSGLLRDLKSLALRYELTLFMILYAGWTILLARLSGQEDVVIGTPTANRRWPPLERLIGFFVNTLVLRVRAGGELFLEEFFTHVKDVTLGAYAHQDVPFERIVEALHPERSLSRNPIFQVLFAFNNLPTNQLELPKLTVLEEQDANESAMFDLHLSLQECADQVNGAVDYALDLFDRETIERWMACFVRLLEEMARQPERRLAKLPILPEDQWRQAVRSFNSTKVLYPHNKLIHELIEEQTLRAPDAVAVECDGACFSYAALNGESNRLAWALREQGVGPDQLVGVCVERSLHMTVGLLAILKAGGAYVPLDPTYPADRLSYMLKDSSPEVVLIQEHLRERLGASAARVIALDTERSRIAHQPADNLPSTVLGLHSRNLAYVIYTSGSTGRPKGAMNEHRGVVNRLLWMQDRYRLSDQDRVLQKTPFSFDVSVWEFFWPLLSGACLVMASREGHKDPAYLRKVIEDTGVTTLHFVPSMLQIFLERLCRGQCANIRRVVCSGEELSASLAQMCLEALPNARLSNLYGPTEAAVDVSAWECRPADGVRIPIGRPIANIRMYVIDQYGFPAPLGVSGEVCIAGVGVGRGYLNRPELTADRFVADPFVDNARMYRTGDRGRWRTDGAIEYLGRNDHQVKIRGFRIELGEIAAQLTQHALVKEAAVAVLEESPGDKRLVAYVVSEEHATIDFRALQVPLLRQYLKERLPEHMIPSTWVALEALPLSPNGKLDRRALPSPSEPAATHEYVAPRTDLELTLAGIWAHVLRLEKIGIRDNFFERGGHSLLATQVSVRIEDVISIEVPVRFMFESPTIEELSARLEARCQERLLGQMMGGGEDVQGLLEKVHAMSDEEVRDLVRTLRAERNA